MFTTSLTFNIQAITGHLLSYRVPCKAGNFLLVKISINKKHHLPRPPPLRQLLPVQRPAVLHQGRVGHRRAGQLHRVALVDGLGVGLETDGGSELHLDLGVDGAGDLLGLVTGLALQGVLRHVGGDGEGEGGDRDELGAAIHLLHLL